MRFLLAIALISRFCVAEELHFEVASVKKAAECSINNSEDAGLISLRGDPLKVILAEAFQVKADQITGPSWLDSECFEIIGKIAPGSTKDQVRSMLRTLLAERLKLTFHKDEREQSGYALVTDKGGVKCKKSDVDPHATRATFGSMNSQSIIRGSMGIAALARTLSRRLNSPVTDLTGLEGVYEIDLSWSPTGGPDLFTAIRESLGLRLESRKNHVEMIIIDHLERVPTSN